MADDAAHIAPGPDAEPIDSGAPAAEAHGADVAVADRPIELVGWQAAASALPAGDDLPVWSFRGGAPGETPPRVAAPPDRHQAELPFAPSTPVSTVRSRPDPTFGPVGRTRSAAAVPLLAVVTLGISALAWHQRLNRELEEFDPKLHSRPGRSTAAVTVPWLIGLLVTLAGAALLVGARLGIHLPLSGHVTTVESYVLLGGLLAVPYLTLVLPFSVVAVVMTLERLRMVEEHSGSTTDRQVRPVTAVLLLAIPVIGGLVLLAAEQRRANDVWKAVAPTGYIHS